MTPNRIRISSRTEPAIVPRKNRIARCPEAFLVCLGFMLELLQNPGSTFASPDLRKP